MKINRLLFNNPDYFLEGDFDFSSFEFDPYHIREIKKCHALIKGSIYEDLLMLNIKIDADVVGVCAYTLNDVPLHLDIQEEIDISNEIEDDDNLYFEKNNIFDIDPYILSLVIANVPSILIKEGAKLPENGDGYRVLTEEEYEEEQKHKTDSRWDALDDIELD